MIVTQATMASREGIFGYFLCGASIAEFTEGGCEFAGALEGVGMIVTQYATASGESILLKFSGCLEPAQSAQIGGETARRPERARVVSA